MSNEFRITYNKYEIYKYLKLCEKRLLSCVIWQSLNDKRIVGKLLIKKIDIEKEEITAQLQEVPENFNFNHVFYINLPTRNSAFKCYATKAVEKTIILNTPKEIIAEESRKYKRSVFSLTDEKYVFLSVFSTGIYSHKSIKVSVIDASLKGLGIKLSSSNKHLLKKDDIVYLTDLGSFKLKMPIEGRITFKRAEIRKGNYVAKKEYCLGISFEDEIPHEIFEKFIFINRNVEIDHEQLIHDQAFRENIKDNMNTLTKKMKKTTIMKKWLATLDIERQENQYLKQHIELLCKVTCGIAKTLGWISDSSFEKLIYISMIHDIRLMAHPSIARIKDKDEFDLIKETLSEDEQKAFLEAPEYASILAREDKNSYPDVDRVLIQQKERSDGTGFPFGIKASKISPLASLFIISHDFVDYILETENWNYKDFYLLAKEKHKGAHFYKILNIFKEL